MNEAQPTHQGNSLENVETVVEKVETEIPYGLRLEMGMAIELFRNDNPMVAETQRVIALWIEEAKVSAREAGLSAEEQEVALKEAEESIPLVRDLARWDTNISPEGKAAYSAWFDATNEWIDEGRAESSDPKRKKWNEQVFDGEAVEVDILRELKGERRQVLVEIERASVYFSLSGVKTEIPDEYLYEAYDCLDRAREACAKIKYLNEATEEMEMHPMNLDLVKIADAKEAAFTKVVKFLNKNAVDPNKAKLTSAE